MHVHATISYNDKQIWNQLLSLVLASNLYPKDAYELNLITKTFEPFLDSRDLFILQVHGRKFWVRGQILQ